MLYFTNGQNQKTKTNIMKFLGIILLLAGIGLIVLYFTKTSVSFLSFMGDMSETMQWVVRGGLVVLGLILVAASGRRS